MYVTVDEFKQSPTAVDISTLDQTNPGVAAAQDAALTMVLRRSSAWVDRIVRMKTLSATTNTEVKEVRTDRDGRITIWPNMAPIINLASVGYRLAPNVSFSNIPLEYVQTFTGRFTIWNINTNTLSPALLLQSQGFTYYSPYKMAQLRDMPIQVQYTYTNGYFNSTLKTAANVGDTSITVKNSLGLQNGSTFTIYDGADTEEDLVVDHVDDTDSTVIHLVEPLEFEHAIGVSTSAIPEAVKQATILLATYLIKERGSVAIVMQQAALQGATSQYNDNRDLQMAMQLLQPYVRVISTDD